MRIGSLVVLLGFLGGISAARADVIVSGSVNITTIDGSGSPGPSCGSSGAAPSSFSVSCSVDNPTASASFSGSGDAFGGELSASTVQDTSDIGASLEARAVASGQLDLRQTYVLLGGFGPATVNFAIDVPFVAPDSQNSWGCVFDFNGVSQSCDDEIFEFGGGTFSEQVEYFVPFSIDFNLSVSSIAETFFDGEQYGSVDYSLTAPGLLLAIPTPEPSSILLLMPGLAGVLFAARSQRKKSIGDM